MQLLYPKAPGDPSKPQWWVFSLMTNPRLKSFSMLLRLGPIAVHYRKNDVDDDPRIFYSHRNYARPSRFHVIRLNNPDKLHPGQVAKILKLICVDCGHEYPCPPNLDTAMLCDCTLVRKNSIMLWWGRNKPLKPGESMYKNSYEFAL